MNPLKKWQKSRQTQVMFGDKWSNNPDLARDSTKDINSKIFKWIIGRNGFLTVEEFELWLKTKSRILDAGCGNGRIIDLFLKFCSNQTQILGIDINIEIPTKRFKNVKNVEILFQDLSTKNKNLGLFDLIYCQEVLHHTINPRKSFQNLVALLAPHGEIAVYVYKKKTPAREYLDEFLRVYCQKLSSEEKRNLMREITIFGKDLQQQNLQLHSTGVSALGIPEGNFPLQAFIYDFFFKCFWNNELNLDDNIAINEDWYYPQLASKHTLDEVLDWFRECNLNVIHENEDANGITIRGVRK